MAKCETCGRSFKTLQGLRSHKRVHAQKKKPGFRQSQEVPPMIGPKAGRGFPEWKCKFCGMRFGVTGADRTRNHYLEHLIEEFRSLRQEVRNMRVPNR